MDGVSAPGSIIDHGLVWLCVVVRALTHNLTNPMLRSAGAEAKTAHCSPWEQGCGDRIGLLLDLRSAPIGIGSSASHFESPIHYSKQTTSVVCFFVLRCSV